MNKMLKSKLFLCVLSAMLVVGGSLFSYAEPTTEQNPTDNPTEENTEQTENQTEESSETPTEENGEKTEEEKSETERTTFNDTEGITIETKGDGTIVVTKKWDDDLTGEEANNRQAPEVMIRGEFLAEELIDFYYPVGSYYETSTDVDPNEVFVGTWVKETEGMVHLSGGSSYVVSKANDNGGAGAQDGGTSKAILPAHTHSVPARGGSTGTVSNDHTHYMKVQADSKTSGGLDSSTYSGTGARYTCPSDSHIHSVTITGDDLSTVGVSSANQNMQPYINVNRWHRIS